MECLRGIIRAEQRESPHETGLWMCLRETIFGSDALDANPKVTYRKRSLK